MKTKKSVIIVMVFLLCFICTSSSKYSYAELYEIEGDWMEYWTSDNSGPIEYNDVYKIAVIEKQLEIICIDKPEYKFSNIKYINRSLQFTLTNEIDPDDLYVIDYKVKINAELIEFTGIAKTNKGVTANIVLKKINNISNKKTEKRKKHFE